MGDIGCFINDISVISNATSSEIKNITIKLTAEPSREHFWMLSRMIEVARQEDLVKLKDSILQVLKKGKKDFLGANFALVRLAKRLGFSVPRICVPNNPVFSSELLSLANVSDECLLSILDFPHKEAQRLVAQVLSQHCSDKKNMLRKIFDTLSNPTNDVTVYGMVMLLDAWSDDDRLISFYIQCLQPVLESDFKSSAVAAQRLLARLIDNNRPAFQVMRQIPRLAKKQIEKRRLEPAFLKSILQCYGIFAVRELANDLLADAMKCLNKGLLGLFIPYLGFTTPEWRDRVQEMLVSKCEAKPLDAELWNMAARAILTSAPAVRPACGRFMELLEYSTWKQEIKSLLRPLLEPSGLAPLRPVTQGAVVDDEDKRSVETQKDMDYRTSEVQVTPDAGRADTAT